MVKQEFIKGCRGVLLLVALVGTAHAGAQAGSVSGGSAPLDSRASESGSPGSALPMTTTDMSETRSDLLELLGRVQAQIEGIPDDATGADAERLADLQGQLELLLTQTQLERVQRENAALRAQLAARGQSPVSGGAEFALLEQRLGDVTAEQENLTSQLQVVAEQHAMILGSSEETETHVVVAGDTLSRLAQTYFDDADLWPEFLEANPDLTDPDRLLPGTRITVPHGY